MESLIDLAKRKGLRRMEITFPIREPWAVPVRASVYMVEPKGLSDVHEADTIELAITRTIEHLTKLEDMNP